MYCIDILRAFTNCVPCPTACCILYGWLLGCCERCTLPKVSTVSSSQLLKPGTAFASREGFESLAGELFKRAAAPAAALLDRNSLKASDLSALELLGGGSRTPGVQAALSAALGGRSLDKCDQIPVAMLYIQSYR